MPSYNIDGTRVDDFTYRNSYEKLAGIKPPNLKVVPRDATAYFDSPHYAQVAAATNKPGIETELMIRDLYEQNDLQRAIQQVNLQGQADGLIPRAGPRQPDGIQANLAQAQAQQNAAVNHAQLALAQAQNDAVAAAAQQAAMGQAAGPTDLAVQGADQNMAAQMLQTVGGRVANQVSRAWHAYVPDPRNLLSQAGVVGFMGAPAPPPNWRPGPSQPGGASSSGAAASSSSSSSSAPSGAPVQNVQRTRAAASGPSVPAALGPSMPAASGPSVPAALMNTPQGEAILREQIAELTARVNHLRSMGDNATADALDIRIARLQDDLSDMLPDVVRYRKHIRELEAEAARLRSEGKNSEAELVLTPIWEIRESIAHQKRNAR